MAPMCPSSNWKMSWFIRDVIGSRRTDWIPLQGEHAALELFILLDDASGTSLGSQLEDIRRFINAQPATTRIGVGYMRDGTVAMAQNLTDDHTMAARVCGCQSELPASMRVLTSRSVT